MQSCLPVRAVSHELKFKIKHLIYFNLLSTLNDLNDPVVMMKDVISNLNIVIYVVSYLL